MKILKKLKSYLLSLISAIFLFSVLPAQSQLTIFSQTSKHIKEINILESGDKELNEKIEKELKRSNNFNNKDHKINVEFTTYISIQRLDSFNIRIFAEVKEFEVKDKLIFREFDMSEFIEPDCFSYNLSVFRAEENFNHLERNFYSDRQIVENRFGYYTLLSQDIQTIDSYRNFNLVLNNIALCGNKNSNERLFAGINTVLEYYESENNLKTLKTKLENIDTEVLERTLFNKILINDINIEISKLEQQDFVNKLNLGLEDPINFLQKITELKDETLRKISILNIRSQQIEFLFYQKGLELRKSGKQQEAIYNFEKALEFRLNYAAALCELADIHFENSNYLEALNKLIQIFDKSELNKEFEEKIVKMWNKNSAKLNDFIKEKTNNQLFSEIQAITDKYTELCKKAEILNCINESANHIKNTKVGFYNSYLTVVEKAIEHRRFEIAQSYIEMSAEYKLQNSEFVEDNKEEEALYNLLIEATIKEIDNLLRQKRNDRAFETLKWLNNLCKDEKTNNCSNIYLANRRTSIAIMNSRLEAIEKDIAAENYSQAQIRLQILYEMLKEFIDIKNQTAFKNTEKKIEQYFYDKEIEEGLVLLEREEYKKAFDLLRHANLKQQEFGLKIHQSFDEYLKSTSIPLINSELSNLFLNLHSTSNQELEKEIERITNLVQAFNLQNETGILLKFVQVEDELSKRRKRAVSDSLQLKLKEAELLRKELKFIKSDSILQLVSEKRDLFYFSNINENEFNNTISKYKTAVSWEYEFRLLNNLISRQMWKNVIEQIESLNTRVKEDQLAAYGIKEISLLEKVKTIKSLDLTIEAYEHYKEQNDYIQALAIIDLMRKSKIKFLTIRKYQREIGVLLAKQDFEKDSEADFKTKVKKYTSNDKYFFYFSRAYLRTIRNIN